MNILIMSNTYLPHVGGVARSVASFREAFQARGHRVLVVTAEFNGMPNREDDVIRIPAIQNFNGSDFSMVLPIPGYLSTRLQDFQPDIVHTQHPFLIGSTAVRVATQREIPLLFTYHTHYEQYTHYVPGHSSRMKTFAIQLAKGYCNLCDHVIAPSESVERLLVQRGVTTPITSIPTGVCIDRFMSGDGTGFRRRHSIPEGAYVIGHVGRLAPEKNLPFLAGAVARFLQKNPRAHFLVVGSGPSREKMERISQELSVRKRVHMAGTLENQDLVDAYHVMDLFAFASKSETQGLVLVEAMAAGLPVVALEASGVREVVRDGVNGRLLNESSPRIFAEVLSEMSALSRARLEMMKQEARRTSREFSLPVCAGKVLAVYREVCNAKVHTRQPGLGFWETATDQLRVEWELLRNMAEAAVSTIQEMRESRGKQRKGGPPW